MTNEKGKCYKQTPLFGFVNTSSALHIFIFSVSYRPTRMSASTDADVCADRCGCLRRPMRMSAPTDADDISWCFAMQRGTCRGTYRGCTCLRSALPLARARSAPTNQELHQLTKKCTNQPRSAQINQEVYKSTSVGGVKTHKRHAPKGQHHIAQGSALG